MPEPYAPATTSTELDRQRKHAEALATELAAARAEVAAAYQHVHEVDDENTRLHARVGELEAENMRLREWSPPVG